MAAYVSEHTQTVEWWWELCAPDAVIAIEIADYRDAQGRCLIPLPDLFHQMIVGAGFRIPECITLVRPLTLGRRSGHFKRHHGAPGYFYPDAITSLVVVAFKGEPMARLRRDGGTTSSALIDARWAERFLKTAWYLQRPKRQSADRRRGHPVPQDAEVVRALVAFYSLAGDRVLDCFAGEGTTDRVALALGRVPVLIEREPAFAALTRARAGSRVLDLGAARSTHSHRWLATLASVRSPCGTNSISSDVDQGTQRSRSRDGSARLR